MTSTISIIGSALSMAIALILALAPGAVAEFKVGDTPATLTSTNVDTQKFLAKESGTMAECTSLTLDDSIVSSSPTEIIQVEPTFGSCKALFGQTVTVDTNGCDFRFVALPSFPFGNVQIECPTSTGIQITVGSLCTYEIDSQTLAGLADYENMGTSATKEVKMVPDLLSLHITRTTHDFPFLCSEGSTFGSYTGSFRVTGEKSGSHVGVEND